METAPRDGRRILTVPNALSLVRIVLIPVFVVLLLSEDHRLAGFFVLAGVVSTDWVDGYIARRYRQVSDVGKVLDPLADRLAMAAALITFVVLDAIPLWVALLILVRDAAVLVAALVLAILKAPRIDVRQIGKNATFTLMWGFPMVGWGNLGLPFADVMLVLGWVWLPVGIIEYYVATYAYVGDVRRVLGGRPVRA